MFQVAPGSSKMCDIETAVDEAMRMMLEVTWGDWVVDSGTSAVTASVVTISSGILPAALSKSLDACEKNGRITDELSTQALRKMLALHQPVTRSAREPAGPLKVDDDKHDGRAVGSNGETHVVAAHDFRAKPAVGFAFFPVEAIQPPPPLPERTSKRAHPAVATIGEVTSTGIRKGMIHSAGGINAGKPKHSLFVWHMGFSGEPDRLAELLLGLQRENLLHPKVRVLLFEGIRTKYGQRDTSATSNAGSDETEATKAAVIRALEVRTSTLGR